jgi:hypothetical protein
MGGAAGAALLAIAHSKTGKEYFIWVHCQNGSSARAGAATVVAICKRRRQTWCAASAAAPITRLTTSVRTAASTTGESPWRFLPQNPRRREASSMSTSPA